MDLLRKIRISIYVGEQKKLNPWDEYGAYENYFFAWQWRRGTTR
jgi:hypothetical protein